MLNQYQTIRDQLTEDVKAAWGVTDNLISYGVRFKPRQPESGKPCVTLVLQPVQRSGQGTRSVREDWTWVIVGEWARDGFGLNGDAEAEKVRLARALGELLVPTGADDATVPTSSPYAGVANLAMVGSVDLDQDDKDDRDAVQRVILTFTCSTFVTQ